MKFKKLLVPFLAACTAVTMAAGLAACNTEGNPDKDKDKNPDTDKTTVTYQFTGEFTNATLSGYGFDYYVLLNLNSDGKVTGSGYNCLSMDNRTAAENSGFAEKWFRGSWESTKNEEDQDCVKITAIYDVDAKNSMTGGNLTNTSTYYVVKKTDGSLGNFNLQTPIFSGTNEYMTQMTQNKTPYANADAFIQANLYTWTAPTGYEAVFETTSDSAMTGKIYLMPNGNADLYSGKQVPGGTDYKFMKGESWKWSYADGVLKIGEHTATVTGTTATLEYTNNVMGHDMAYKYACADISGLTETEPENPEVPAPAPETVATLTAAEGGYTATFYKDGTVKLTTSIQQLSPEWRWTYSDGAFTLKEKDKEDAPGGTTITVDGNTATLTYAPAFLQGASITYTGDVSAIIAQ